MDLAPLTDQKDIILLFKSTEYKVYGSKLMQVSPLFKTLIVKFSKTLIPILRNYSVKIFEKFVKYVNGEETKLENSEIPEFFQLCQDYKCDVIIEQIKSKMSQNSSISPQSLLDSLFVALVSNQNTSEYENYIAKNLSQFVELPAFSNIPIHVLMRIFFNGGYCSEPDTLIKFFSVSFAIDQPSTIYMLQYLDLKKQNWSDEDCAAFSGKIVNSNFPILSFFLTGTTNLNDKLTKTVEEQNKTIIELDMEKQSLSEKVTDLNNKIKEIEETRNSLSKMIMNKATESETNGYDIFEVIDNDESEKINSIYRFKSTYSKFQQKKEVEIDGITYQILPLHYAFFKQKQNVIKLLLSLLGNKIYEDFQLNPNQTTPEGYTPLFFCILSKSNTSTFKNLLEKGAEIDYISPGSGRKSPLLEAIDRGQESIAKCFLQYYIKYQKLLIFRAEEKILFRALEMRMDLTDLIIKTHSKENLNELVNGKDENGFSPLHVALRYGNYNAVQTLLENGADINYSTNDGYYPIHRAATKIDSNILKLILNQSTNLKIDLQDAVGNTPLILSVKYSLINNIKLLMEKGANPEIKNFLNQTAYNYATNDQVKLALQETHNNHGRSTSHTPN